MCLPGPLWRPTLIHYLRFSCFFSGGFVYFRPFQSRLNRETSRSNFTANSSPGVGCAIIYCLLKIICTHGAKYKNGLSDCSYSWGKPHHLSAGSIAIHFPEQHYGLSFWESNLTSHSTVAILPQISLGLSEGSLVHRMLLLLFFSFF